MIGRRSIRVKVMQALYTHEKDPSVNAVQLKKLVENNIHTFYKLYVLNLYLLAKSAEYATSVATVNASKFLPTEDEKNFSLRIFHNPIIQRIVLDENYLKVVKKEGFDLRFDELTLKKYFLALYERPSYKKYVNLASADIADDYYLLSELYTDVLCASDDFDTLLEDIYPVWHDDKEAIIVLVRATLQSLYEKPGKKGINAPGTFDEEIKLANALIDNYFIYQDEFTTLIKQRLKNWDEERIAEVDMLLMKMCVSEFLYQPEIPVKVSINEYLEIAKNYSTPNSSDFINGILDSILKELKESGKIQKAGRGVKEN